MNSVKLNAYYRLYAFSDYQSMKSALPYMRRVMLAKPLAEVEEAEARRFVSRASGGGFTNYLQPLGIRQTVRSGTNSLITALQLLYKSNGYSARYIVIERS